MNEISPTLGMESNITQFPYDRVTQPGVYVDLGEVASSLFVQVDEAVVASLKDRPDALVEYQGAQAVLGNVESQMAAIDAMLGLENSETKAAIAERRAASNKADKYITNNVMDAAWMGYMHHVQDQQRRINEELIKSEDDDEDEDEHLPLAA